MESKQAGDYIAIVVQLRAAAGGNWYVDITGTHHPKALLLMPLTLIMRLWRTGDTQVLRGTIRLQGSDNWAPIQTNAQMEELLRAWLLSGDSRL